MDKITCAWCGCEQTPEGKILKEGKAKSDDKAELMTEIRELRKENKELLTELKAKNKKPSSKPHIEDEEKSIFDR